MLLAIKLYGTFRTYDVVVVFEELVHGFIHDAARHHLGYRAEGLSEEIVFRSAGCLFDGFAYFRANLLLVGISSWIGNSENGYDEDNQADNQLYCHMALSFLWLLLEVGIHGCSLLETLLVSLLLSLLICLLLSLLRSLLLRLLVFLLVRAVWLVGFNCLQYSSQFFNFPSRSPISHSLLPD